MKNFKEMAVKGISWKMIGQVGIEVIQFTVAVILAHLLTPRDFGLIAMVTILMNFAAVISIAGRAALVQKAEVSQGLLSSMFWLNVIVGLLLTLILMACAPLIARAYGEPQLVWLTIFFSATFLINSFGITHNALLQRAIDFRSFAIMDVTAYGVAGLVAITAAYYGFGVWSLVLQALVVSSICLAVFWLRCEWRPDFRFEPRAVREILSFSVNALLSDVLVYFVRNVDNLLIGLFLGSGPLGIYSRAYAVMLVPVNRVARVLSDVMYPSLAMIQHDQEHVKRVFLKMTRAVALVTFPMMLGVLAIADHFVLSLFGPKWSEMIPVLEVLCLIGMLQSVTMFRRNIYISQNRADLLLRVELPLQLLQILGIVIGLQWGVMGVASGYAAASIAVAYPGVYFAGRLIGLGCWEYTENLLGVLGCAVAMSAVVWKLGHILPASMAGPAAMAVEIGLGVLVYCGLLHAFSVDAYVEVRTIALKQLRSRLKGAGAAA